MLQTTKGIVLRSVKYGETSLICTVFTSLHGVQSYMVQGVRSSKSKQQRAGLLQSGSLLDLVVDQKPQRNLQRIREYHAAHIYMTLHEEIIKNSIALFSIELLLRLLPEHAAMPELFEFSYEYLVLLDTTPLKDAGNFPLYFIIHCSRLLGYEIRGHYGPSTPFLDIAEGAFSAHPPAVIPYLTDEETRALNDMLNTENIQEIIKIELNAAIRSHLLDWYIEFLHRHTQHLGSIKSLSVLQAVLH